MRKINLLEPNLFKNEKKYLNQCLRFNEISTYGRFINKFENKVKKISNSKYCVALTSGSVSLYLSLKAININENDIVILPSYTFAATINSVIHSSATPLLFDIDEKTLCLDLESVENFLLNNTFKRGEYTYEKNSKKRIYCIMPVTTFSIVPDLQKIKKISKKFNLKVIIDAASGLGSKFNGKSMENYSDIVIYSFNGNKSYTSGGGGIVSTNQKKYEKYVRLLSTNSKSKLKPYRYKMPGHNFKITNLHAAIGLGQLENINYINKKKNEIQKFYFKNINNKNILFPPKPNWSNHILWLNFILVKNKHEKKKIEINFKKINFKFFNFWQPLHLQKNFKFICGSSFNNTEKISKNLLVLPSSINTPFKILKKIADAINKK